MELYILLEGGGPGIHGLDVDVETRKIYFIYRFVLFCSGVGFESFGIKREV